MTLRFLLLLGGSFTSFFMTIALAIPPLTMVLSLTFLGSVCEYEYQGSQNWPNYT